MARTKPVEENSEKKSLIDSILQDLGLSESVSVVLQPEKAINFNFFISVVPERGIGLKKVEVRIPEDFLRDDEFLSKVKLCDLLARVKLLFRYPELSFLYDLDRVRGDEIDAMRFYFYVLPLQGMWSFPIILNYFKAKGEEEKFITALIKYYLQLLKFIKKKKIGFNRAESIQDFPVLYVYWLSIFYTLIFEKLFLVGNNREKELYSQKFPEFFPWFSAFREQNIDILSLYYEILSRGISVESIKYLVEKIQEDFEVVFEKGSDGLVESVVLKRVRGDQTKNEEKVVKR